VCKITSPEIDVVKVGFVVSREEESGGLGSEMTYMQDAVTAETDAV
jgi:hypothetical protein